MCLALSPTSASAAASSCWALWGAAEDCVSTWVPDTWVRNPEGVSGSWVGPGPVMAVVGQQMQVRSLSLPPSPCSNKWKRTFFVCNIYLNFLFERVTERERGTERYLSYPLLHSSNGHRGQSWAGPQLGARNFFWGSCMGAGAEYVGSAAFPSYKKGAVGIGSGAARI